MSGEEEREHKVDVCDEGRSGGEGMRMQFKQVKSRVRRLETRKRACAVGVA